MILRIADFGAHQKRRNYTLNSTFYNYTLNSTFYNYTLNSTFYLLKTLKFYDILYANVLCLH